MIGMAIRGTKDARGLWFFVVAGAVIGLVLGILVSVTTDVPLAPEAGVVLGALVGWLSRRVSSLDPFQSDASSTGCLKVAIGDRAAMPAQHLADRRRGYGT